MAAKKTKPATKTEAVAPPEAVVTPPQPEAAPIAAVADLANPAPQPAAVSPTPAPVPVAPAETPVVAAPPAAAPAPAELDKQTEEQVDALAKVMEEKEVAARKTKWTKMGVLTVIVMAFMGGGLGGFLLAKSPIISKPVVKAEEKVEKTAPTPTGIAISPTSSLEEVSRNELKVMVLNGSGVKGAAGIAADYLETLGYKEVETGNAGADTYKQTVIRLKEAKMSFATILTNDLKGKYAIAEKTEKLDASESYDAVIIMGKE